jgi:D-alanyl-D-alanine endopeptidase (penicillin-binding protein 7)
VCHDADEFLGAALVASDNRGAMGLATLSGLEYDQFLGRMRDVAQDLRMEGDTWSDPSGLEDDNLATARDMLKAVTATAAHPALAPVASADSWRIERKQGPHHLGTTNRLVRRWETLAAKTGYTDTARYCFATVVRTGSGRTLAVSVLGAPTSASRFSDTAALVRWAESVADAEALEERAARAHVAQKR